MMRSSNSCRGLVRPNCNHAQIVYRSHSSVAGSAAASTNIKLMQRLRGVGNRLLAELIDADCGDDAAIRARRGLPEKTD